MSWDQAEKRAKQTGYVPGLRLSEQQSHDFDVYNLEEVLRCELHENEDEAFSNMLDDLMKNPTRALTEKQRAWLQRVSDRVGSHYEDEKSYATK